MSHNRIIEIATNNKHLSVERGFMVVTEDRQEIARFPLDDIAAVIGSAHGLTYSNNLLAQLATRNAMFIICGKNFLPIAFLWAAEGHHLQSARIKSQIVSSISKKKRIWKQIVTAKVTHQAKVLFKLGHNETALTYLLKKIRSGDPANIEALAARRYWPFVFGKGFIRDQKADGANAMLNYGYTIIRSAMARAVMAAGLHLSIGIHYRNQYNSMCLVDDLMEPFRPYVDLAICNLIEQKKPVMVSPEVKNVLVSMLEMPVSTRNGMTPLRTAIQNTAISLGLVFAGQRDELDVPIFD